MNSVSTVPNDLTVVASSADRAGAAAYFTLLGMIVQSRRLSTAMDVLIRNAKDVGGMTSCRRGPTRAMDPRGPVMRVGSR